MLDSSNKMQHALHEENEKFNQRYRWFINSMEPVFFEEIDQTSLMLIVHNIMEFEAQDYFSIVQLKHFSIVICLDTQDVDLHILQNFSSYGIQSYQTYVSKTPAEFLSTKEKIRIIVMHFYGYEKAYEYQQGFIDNLRASVAQKYPTITNESFETALHGMVAPFLHSLPLSKAAIAISMYDRATTRDNCQYEMIYNEDWENKKLPSLQIIMAWRNSPRHNFLYRLVRVIHRHGLSLKQMNASYNNIYDIDSILVLSLDLHGADNEAAWNAANILNFVKELITVKYFASFDYIDRQLVHNEIVSGNMANMLRSMEHWIHQSLVHLNVHIYTLEHIEEGLCRHPELTSMLCEAFKYKFDPSSQDLKKYQTIHNTFLSNVDKLDTGHEENDTRRKSILLQGMNFIHFCLKTNFYRPNYSSLGFRLDPEYLNHIPGYDRTKKFPEMPYAIFFIKGMHFFGFHIRFKDLARGGLRTVFPEYTERMVLERNTVFYECYNLALTQHMKNKDIPEGGAKGIIFLQPYEHLESEISILRNELASLKYDPEAIENACDRFRKEQRLEHLYQAQRSFIETLITLVNALPDGKLKAKDIIDYWNKPEYIYLGPDENLHDSMIQWIANYSRKSKYKPGSSFISGKPQLGINHKQFGVTSLGVNVYVNAILRYLGIDPQKQTFTIKMSGGPDGDVAGNEIKNLSKFYPKTAKLVALTDVSGTINDPEGLDLEELSHLFQNAQSIRFYPPQKLHEGAFLVDKFTKRFQTPLIQQTLCWRKKDGRLIEDWLSGNEMNHLIRYNVHQTKADIFVPGGGRPRMLNEANYKEFLDPQGMPTAKAIVEGANLYLSPGGRKALEDLGVLIIKDSSANKTGVICSSFEVLCGLTLGDDKFVANKAQLVEQILERLHNCANNEASLLLKTHQETKEHLTDISDKISKRINLFTDQILNYLDTATLSNNKDDPLIQNFYNYCLPLLREHYSEELMREIPDNHKKAIIACYIASNAVYTRGLSWFPSIVDILTH